MLRGNFVFVNSIKEWLNGSRDYSLGVALYEAHGTDEGLKQMFAQGFSQYRQQRLVAALQELKEHPTIVELPSEPRTITVAVNEAVLPENLVPAERDPYRQRWLPLYQQMNYLRHQLRTAADDTKRGEMAHEILSLEEKCYQIWEERDYFIKYGQPVPNMVTDTITVTDRNELHRKLMNYRTYITKAKKCLKENPEDAKAAARKLHYELEVQRIEEKLKAL